MQAGESLETQRTPTGPHTVPDESWLPSVLSRPNTVLSALHELTQLTVLGSRCPDESRLTGAAKETQYSSLSKVTEFVNGGKYPRPCV